jgi:hypothetical protein
VNICLSGGCGGADTVFGEQAALAGHEVVHWSFGGHHSKCENLRILNSQQLMEADEYLKKASKLLKRHYPSRFVYTNNLLRRNYYQIKTTDRIYAVSSLEENGSGRVKGGTGWAVAMGIQSQVPEIYFFDQECDTWFKHIWWGHTEWGWEKFGAPPIPHGIYTGIGTRELNESGKQAIVKLYEK